MLFTIPVIGFSINRKPRHITKTHVITLKDRHGATFPRHHHVRAKELFSLPYMIQQTDTNLVRK